MGVDFIREQSGKPWHKRWDKGLDRLKVPGLFDIHFSCQQRTITVDIEPGMRVVAGEQLVVQCQSAVAVVSRGLNRIGVVDGLPSDIQVAITACGGVAVGTVERVSLFGNSAELSIR